MGKALVEAHQHSARRASNFRQPKFHQLISCSMFISYMYPCIHVHLKWSSCDIMYINQGMGFNIQHGVFFSREKGRFSQIWMAKWHTNFRTGRTLKESSDIQWYYDHDGAAAGAKDGDCSFNQKRIFCCLALRYALRFPNLGSRQLQCGTPQLWLLFSAMDKSLTRVSETM